MTASTTSENIFFLKPETRNTEDASYRPETPNIAPYIRDNILFLNTLNGYDTTSVHFRQRKKKFVKVLDTTVLQQVMNIFRDENICSDDIDDAGHTFWYHCMGERAAKKLYIISDFHFF